MCILALLLLATCLSAAEIPSRVLVFVTPSVYLDKDVATCLNVSWPGQLSSFGLRQAYLIGRDLRSIYVEKYHTLPGSPLPSELLTAASSSATSAQTLSAILQGLLLPGSGPTIGAMTLQRRAVPPVPGHDFANWSAELRDASLAHYIQMLPIRSAVYGLDTFFSADTVCPGFIASSHGENSCQRDLNATAACKETYLACRGDAGLYKNGSDEVLCRCFEAVRSAQRHEIAGRIANVSARSMAVVEDMCDLHTLSVFDNAPTSAKVKMITDRLMRQVADFVSRVDSAVMSIYVLEPVQMKALIYLLAEDYPERLPRHGSTVRLELFPAEGKGSYLKLSINKQPATISGKDNISSADFLSFVSDRLLGDFEATCFATPSPASESSLLWLWLTLSIGGSAVAVAGSLALYCRLSRKEPHEHLLVEDESDHVETKKDSIVSGQPEVVEVETVSNPSMQINQSAYNSSN